MTPRPPWRDSSRRQQFGATSRSVSRNRRTRQVGRMPAEQQPRGRCRRAGVSPRDVSKSRVPPVSSGISRCPAWALSYAALIRTVGISLRSTVASRNDGQVAIPVVEFVFGGDERGGDLAGGRFEVGTAGADRDTPDQSRGRRRAVRPRCPLRRRTMQLLRRLIEDVRGGHSGASGKPTRLRGSPARAHPVRCRHWMSVKDGVAGGLAPESRPAVAVCDDRKRRHLR